jgi:pyruvate ferredoxin oxidoreductase beta subunit
VQEEIRLPGHVLCPGCAGAIAERLIFNTLGRNIILFGGGVCASGGAANATVPSFSLHFSGVGAGAAGIAAALEAKGVKDVTVVAMNGDGAISDIGFSKLSACAERGDNIMQFCMDNEAYMNTGIQRSGLTPWGAWTTTTPKGKQVGRKKDLPMIMASHNIPYVATLSPAYPKDFTTKVSKAAGIEGFKYLHVLVPCPTGWRFGFDKTIEVARLAVQTGMWPLYEVDHGVLKITQVVKERKPVVEYLKLQGRFRQLGEKETQTIQASIDESMARLEQLDGKRIY